MTTDDLYSEDHVPDPVTHDAVAAAMAATDTQNNDLKWWQRPMLILGTIAFVIAVICSAGTGVLILQNSHQNNTLSIQNSQLAVEQKCLSTLVASFEADQLARIQIAKDDRDVVDDLVTAITKSTSSAQRRDALSAYAARRKENENRRKALPATAPACSLDIVNNKTLVTPSSSPTP